MAWRQRLAGPQLPGPGHHGARPRLALRNLEERQVIRELEQHAVVRSAAQAPDALTEFLHRHVLRRHERRRRRRANGLRRDGVGRVRVECLCREAEVVAREAVEPGDEVRRQLQPVDVLVVGEGRFDGHVPEVRVIRGGGHGDRELRPGIDRQRDRLAAGSDDIDDLPSVRLPKVAHPRAVVERRAHGRERMVQHVGAPVPGDLFVGARRRPVGGDGIRHLAIHAEVLPLLRRHEDKARDARGLDAHARVLQVEEPLVLRHLPYGQLGVRRHVLPDVRLLTLALEHQRPNRTHAPAPAHRLGRLVDEP